MTDKKGFTLVELLIVIAVIAILAAVAYVAIDPATRIKQANDAQRWADTTAVLDATMNYIVDNDGTFPEEATWTAGNYYVLGTDASGCDATCTAQTTQAACLDLGTLVTEGYLAALPTDPSTGSAANSDYYAYRSSAGIVTVGACDPQEATEIAVSR